MTSGSSRTDFLQATPSIGGGMMVLFHRLPEQKLRELVLESLREKQERGELSPYLAAVLAALDLLEMDLDQAARYAKIFASLA